MVTVDMLDEFIAGKSLPGTFREDAERFFLPLADRLADACPPSSLLGVAGPQGTGKSTIAELLTLALNRRGRATVCLSLDDFYLTKAERARRAAAWHSLFATRGVPGTHDIDALASACHELLESGPDSMLDLPVFDKSLDDRAAAPRRVPRPADIVIVEGWCIGIPPQTDDELADPVNALERSQDSRGLWRRAVNAELAGAYARFFARIRYSVWLQPPGAESIVRWRQEQERKLGDAARGPRSGLMSEQEIRDFVAYFERLTWHGMRTMPRLADAVIELDQQHRCAGVHFRCGRRA